MTIDWIRNGIAGALVWMCASVLFQPPASAGEARYSCGDLVTRGPLSGFGAALYQADDGWFFRDNDFNQWYPLSTTTDRFLLRLQSALALHDVDLVLMPLPPKAVLSARHAVGAAAADDLLFDAALARKGFQKAIARLQGLGVEVVDILGFLAANTPADAEFYFAQDLHWRPTFARLTAEAVASVIKAGPKADMAGTKTFTTRLVATEHQVNRPKSNRYLNQLCDGRVDGEDLDLFATEASDDSLTSFLGDDAMAPVSVIGTSFTDEQNPFNFAGFLREALGADVASYSISGGDIDQSIYRWSHRGLAASGTHVLLWEIPYLERLEQAAMRMERQVVPAVVGSCEGSPNAVASAAFEVHGEKSFVFAAPAASEISGDGYYLGASLADPSARAFTVTFTYRDGEEDVLPLVRTDGVGALPSLFAELPDDITSALQSVTLAAADGVGNNGTLVLCKYPSAFLGASR